MNAAPAPRPPLRGGLLAVLFFAVFRAAQPAPAGTLTVATYNVRNYTLENRMADGEYKKEYPKPESEKNALRAVIKAIGADVLALQEMGPRPFLDELRRDLRSDGVDYPYGIVLDAQDADRHLAVLSKRPFVSVGRHTDLRFSYFGEQDMVKRGLLEVRVAAAASAAAAGAAEAPGAATAPSATKAPAAEPAGAGAVTIFVVHLKSRYTDRPDDPESAIRRASEAVTVRDRMLKIFPDPAGARFLLVGDCNDTRSSRPLRALSRRGDTLIADILPSADTRGEVWTLFWAKQDTYSRFDHILVSPGLRAAVAGGAAWIYDGPQVMQASDHRPVVVRLEIADAK
ncbi:MAG: endonuclease/exonuclease/phosphatase family protein [Opitutaceae bacterium]|jgi:endonuclease/exonuclease/phosphatase family metal-dependent hydrolase|nr:endonuclease/exonuclease/phosphatase family protein [Opitutaceae bacterium]